MWKSLRLLEIEIEFRTIVNVYTVWYTDDYDFYPTTDFNTYEDAICFVYNQAYNGALDLSLESMVKLTKEYNKIETR